MTTFEIELQSLIKDWLERGESIMAIYDTLHTASDTLREALEKRGITSAPVAG